MILMKYHAFFVIFEKAAKFEIVVCCKIYVALYGSSFTFSFIAVLRQASWKANDITFDSDDTLKSKGQLTCRDERHTPSSSWWGSNVLMFSNMWSFFQKTFSANFSRKLITDSGFMGEKTPPFFWIRPISCKNTKDSNQITLVNVYVDLLVLTRNAGTSDKKW